MSTHCSWNSAHCSYHSKLVLSVRYEEQSPKKYMILTKYSFYRSCYKRFLSKEFCSTFHQAKIVALHNEMWYNDHHFKTRIKFDMHKSIHLILEGKQIIMLDNINICLSCLVHYFVMFRAKLFRQMKMHLLGGDGFHGFFLKNVTKHAIASFAWNIFPQTNFMPHKSHTLADGEEMLEMFLLKWKEILKEVNESNAYLSLPLFLYQKVSTYRYNTSTTMSWKKNNNFMHCFVCDDKKNLCDKHPIGLALQWWAGKTSCWIRNTQNNTIMLVDICLSTYHLKFWQFSMTKWIMQNWPSLALQTKPNL